MTPVCPAHFLRGPPCATPASANPSQVRSLSLCLASQEGTHPLTLDAAATDNELLRNAYKYIRDNTQLDFRTRAAAMHKLNAMPTDVRLALPFLFLPRLRLTLFWTA